MNEFKGTTEDFHKSNFWEWTNAPVTSAAIVAQVIPAKTHVAFYLVTKRNVLTIRVMPAEGDWAQETLATCMGRIFSSRFLRTNRPLQKVRKYLDK